MQMVKQQRLCYEEAWKKLILVKELTANRYATQSWVIIMLFCTLNNFLIEYMCEIGLYEHLQHLLPITPKWCFNI